MPKLLGFDVWVEMEGAKLQEYNTETSANGTEISCWIPCEAGKVFRIECSLSRELVRKSHHRATFHFDGRRAYLKGGLIRKDPQQDSDILVHYEVERVGNGASWNYFQLQFGNLELTDDEECLGDAELLSKLGEIRVTVSSVGRLVETKKALAASILPGPGSHRIHERSKKGLSHCVRSKVNAFIAIGWYRHIDVLRANGIAPSNASSDQNRAGPSGGSDEPRPPARKRAPEKIKEEEGSDTDTETNEEIRKLKAQLAALENKVKSRNADRPSKRVKREPTSTLVHGEVIDLTI